MSARSELTGQLGRYRIVRKLGEGGMGAVYLADDTQIGRPVALKVPHFDDKTKPAIIERFQREARLAARIDHPNLCAVHDVGEIGGVHYFTMPFIQGTPLAELLDENKPWLPAVAGGLLRKVALAVGKLHEKGIVHRDLKPSNIMIRDGGEPVLMDFGLARSFNSAQERLTTTGAAMGSPPYMSPEQVNGSAHFTPATDTYGLGVIYYELITGKLPFQAPNLLALFNAILTVPVPPPSQRRPGVDPRLDAFCLKALAKKPEERFADAASLIAALGETLRQLNQPNQPTAPLAPYRDAQAERSAQHLDASGEPRGVPHTIAPPVDLERTTVFGAPSEPLRLSRLVPFLLLVALILGAGLTFLATRPDDKPPPVPPAPTPSLEVVSLADAVLEQGQSTTLRVRVRRVACADAIDIRPHTDEQGVTLAGAVPAEADEGRLDVAVAAGATAGERRVRLRLQAGQVSVETTWTLTIRAAVAPAQPTLTINPLEGVVLRRGETRTILVNLTRKNCPGLMGLELAAGNGIKASKGLVRKDETQGSLEVTAAADAPAGNQKLRLRAHGEVDAEADLIVTIEVHPAAAPALHTIDLDGVKLEMVRVGKGKFWMGSPKDEEHRDKEREEQKEVTIAADFYIGKYEVTQEQWQAVMGANPSYFSRTGDSKASVEKVGDAELKLFPVENVSWDNIQEFLKKLNEREKDKNSGWLYRLPREAEWEYSCRREPFSSGEGKNTAPFYFDKATFALSSKDANFDSRYPYGGAPKTDDYLQRPCKVGSYKANPLGIYDMHGNVWEWCDDLFQGGPERVRRGGSWYGSGQSCRAAVRGRNAPTVQYCYLGFRLARAIR